MMADLTQLRQQIDALDAEILQKLSQRARCAQAVGEAKIASEGKQGVFYRPERERQVLERIKALNEGPLPDAQVMRLFREIMSLCLALELPLNVAYLGPEGTFTQAAALKQFGQAVMTLPKRSIGEVFLAVENDECQYGVVPVENSTEGMVTHTLDRLMHSPLTICSEVQMPIEQYLLTHATDLNDIKVVYSHAQSLAQCRGWLAEHLADATLITVNSNAEAARRATNEPNAAAIAGKAAADYYQLPILLSRIEDELHNTTRFLVLGKQEVGISGHDKTTILVSANNRPGLLYKLLQPIERYGVNMTRIESRPNKQDKWQYVFFIDLEGHQSQLQDLFAEMRAQASLFRVLGSYPKALEDY